MNPIFREYNYLLYCRCGTAVLRTNFRNAVCIKCHGERGAKKETCRSCGGPSDAHLCLDCRGTRIRQYGKAKMARIDRL